MNKIKFTLKNSAVLAVLISSFIACDKDFATVGSDIIGQNNFGVTSKKYPVKAYTSPLPAVQTNNLPINYLGAYNDPFYGLMTASFVGQMGSSFSNPNFGEGAELDSVVLTIPYFNRRTDVNSDGETIYELDSIFGNGSIDLKLYENKYFLNNINPNEEFGTPLNYFSNSSTSVGSINQTFLRGEEILLESEMSPLTNVISNFRPSNSEINLLNVDTEVTTRLAPALRVKLEKTYWQGKIIDRQGDIVLSNASNFNNYFRGLYIEASPIDNDGSMALLNFGTTAANITLYYSIDPDEVDGERTKASYILTFNGNKVNFITNQFNFNIPQGNPDTGDEKLFLKGGEGAVAVVDIFNAGNSIDGNSPEYLAFKNAFVETDITTGKYIKSKRLINEANLVFYVDQSADLQNEPERIYLYDLNNNTPLIDYYLDASNAAAPNSSKINHLGPLQREGGVSTGAGVKYKIKITEHINALLLRDSTNVKFGLAVASNVNLENSGIQYKVLTSDDNLVNEVPLSSILSPRGTVLYGNNTTDLSKKLQLEIFYTCIDNDANCDED